MKGRRNTLCAFLLENGYFLMNKFSLIIFFLLYVLFGPKKIRALVSKKSFDGNPPNGLYRPKGGGGGGEAKK